MKEKFNMLQNELLYIFQPTTTSMVDSIVVQHHPDSQMKAERSEMPTKCPTVYGTGLLNLSEF